MHFPQVKKSTVFDFGITIILICFEFLLEGRTNCELLLTITLNEWLYLLSDWMKSKLKNLMKVPDREEFACIAVYYICYTRFLS